MFFLLVIENDSEGFERAVFGPRLEGVYIERLIDFLKILVGARPLRLRLEVESPWLVADKFWTCSIGIRDLWADFDERSFEEIVSSSRVLIERLRFELVFSDDFKR